jgi:hypothetical protein
MSLNVAPLPTVSLDLAAFRLAYALGLDKLAVDKVSCLVLAHRVVSTCWVFRTCCPLPLPFRCRLRNLAPIILARVS